MVFEHAIALTGGIATGKSTTADMLHEYGFKIIDSDVIAHNNLQEYSSLVSTMFGSEYVDEGIVNRKRLGKYLFANKSELKRLENFLHPLIHEEIKRKSEVNEEKEKTYFIDIPLFFENSNYLDIKTSICVYAPKEIQIERMMIRDNLSLEEIHQRLDAQIDIEEKKTLADYIIDNSKDTMHLDQEISKFINKLYLIGE